MLVISENTYYTIEDLMEGFGWAKSSIYEFFNRGLPFSKPGNQRVIQGADLLDFLAHYKQVRRRKAHSVLKRKKATSLILLSGGDA